MLKKYGPEDTCSQAAVVKAPIGNLGMFICYDGWFPELALSSLLSRLAKVMLRPMGAAGLPTVAERDWWVMQNRSRAYENLAYLIGPNWADSPDSDVRQAPRRGTSRCIVDFRSQHRRFPAHRCLRSGSSWA